MPEDTEDTIVAIVRLVEQAFNTDDMSAWDCLVHPDHVDHSAMPVEVPGAEGFKRRIQAVHVAFSDIHARIDDILVQGHRAAWRWTLDATHTGEFMGVPPTGRHVTVTGINIDRVEGDRIVESWSYPDLLGLLRQLWALPEPEPPPEGS
jgi:steroid delta-isomerase-like uncharacterized protein